MFNINEYEPEEMNQEDVIAFHNVTSKRMYLEKRDRPDLQLGVTLLCTMVKDPDKDDWKNLNWVIRYI